MVQYSVEVRVWMSEEVAERAEDGFETGWRRKFCIGTMRQCKQHTLADRPVHRASFRQFLPLGSLNEGMELGRLHSLVQPAQILQSSLEHSPIGRIFD